MLSSIHPLGERARHNHWAVTVTAFTVSAMAVAGAIGAGLGALGSFAVGSWDSSSRLVATGLAVLVAGVLDLLVAPLGPERQVNEHWIGHFRGWVYGGAFGAELGAGLATYVVTWTVYATLAAEFLTGNWLGGLVVGAIFGLGRSIVLVLAGWVDRPSRLTTFHRRLAALGPMVRRATSGVVAVAGAVAVVGGVM
jgi:hypothetical protein